MRFTGLGLLPLIATFWIEPAWAQMSADLVTTDFTLRLQRPAGDNWVDLSIVDAALYLNQARCLCDSRIRILVQMASGSRSKLTNPSTTGAYARLYVGTNCASLNGLNQPSCPDGLLGQVNGLATFSSTGIWAVETTVSGLFPNVQDVCESTLNTAIYLWLDSAGRGFPDPGIIGASAPSLGVTLDGTPPPAPEGIVVEGADRSLQVSWNDESADNPDLAGYLVFCMGEDGQPVFTHGFYDDQYRTGLTECRTSEPLPSRADPMVSAAGNTTAVEIDSPQAFRNLGPRFLCSGRLSATNLSHRLRLLQNGVPYTVGVAAVDISGNASPIRKAFVQSPIAGVDPIPDTDTETGADAGIARLGSRSGCDCRVARADEDASPWIAMLLLLLLSRRLRRRSNQDV